MKIIFYETKFNKYSINSLVGALEQRELLDSIDIEISSFPHENIKAEMGKTIIFCYSFCTPQLQDIEESVKKVKEKFPNSLLIAGGPHPSGTLKDTLNLGFDYVFTGEAEESFIEFIRNFNHSLSNKIIFKGKPVDINQYRCFSLKFKRFSPIEITRGCPFACKFCQTSYIFGTKPRHRSIENILFHVENFIKNDKRDLRFITPNALSYGSMDGKTVNLTAVESLLRSIKETFKDVRIFFGNFPSELRPEHITKESLELIKQYISNKNLTIGAQSGSNIILEKLNRGHTVEDVYNAVSVAINKGFSVNVDFIFGLPEETEKQQKETINLIERIIQLGNKRNTFVKIHSHYFIPLPGTPLQNSKPSKVSKELTSYLGKLYNLKNIFGQWDLQRRYTEKIQAKTYNN